MHIFLFNFSWMTLNVVLALIAVILGYLFLLTKNKILKYIYAIFWLLFVPNTIYLATDIINLIWQWGRINGEERILFAFQLVALQIICVITFVLALYPFEKFISGAKWAKKKINADLMIILLNFIIGFGITLGRVERINSWDAVVAPQRVIRASMHILLSPNLLLLTALFSLFSSLLYFVFRKPILKYFNTYLSRVAA